MFNYDQFLDQKTHASENHGFEPLFIPKQAKDFQAAILRWSVLKGRSATFADCGLGKTFMQLAWAQNIVQKTNRPVLLLTPLSVASQTVKEGERFGIECKRSKDGTIPAKIVITNYQQLHKFNWQDFDGVACDESSILKNFDGQIKAQVTDFMRKLHYRSLWTATAAPNDYIELGTSSEALGYLGFADMVSRFFKKAEATTSRSQEFRAGVYRFRGYAERDFWRWICSWARAIRFPSDMGCSNQGYKLPKLNTVEHVVQAATRREDMLFDMPAITLQEQRDERRRTLNERCELAASLINAHKKSAVAWCQLNAEGKLLEKLIDGAVEVDGSDDDDFKEETFEAFAAGQIRALVSKATVAGFGLNWQHCAHQTCFPSHSLEQFYQCVRRSWRFGQKNPVTVDMISSEGERGVLANLNRKSVQMDIMFAKLVELMNNELAIEKINRNVNPMDKPSWL